MKFAIRLHAGCRHAEHELEVRPATVVAQADGAQIRCVVDGKEAEAYWTEITPGVYSILIGGRSYEGRVVRQAAWAREAAGRENPWVVTVGTRQYLVEVQDSRLRQRPRLGLSLEGPQEIVAPMPGKIVKVLVEENQEVSPEQGLLVIEAMKMQNELRAPRPGRVEKVYVVEGMGVETGFKLLRLA